MQSLARAPRDARVLAHVAAVLELAGRDEYARSFRERLVQASPADGQVREVSPEWNAELFNRKCRTT